jgi:RNA polymerase sigma-70 factor (ECF subfamily)
MSDAGEDVCAPEVFNGIFLKLAPLLRNFLIYKFRFAAHAEDLVQEAFTVLWENCARVSPPLAKAYLYKVALNASLKRIQKEKLQSNATGINLEIVDHEDPVFKIEHQELAVKLQSAIAALPEGQREVFLMNRMDKLTYLEIADTLGVSVKSVEKRMHKALLKLREICKGI